MTVFDHRKEYRIIPQLLDVRVDAFEAKILYSRPQMGRFIEDRHPAGPYKHNHKGRPTIREFLNCSRCASYSSHDVVQICKNPGISGEWFLHKKYIWHLIYANYRVWEVIKNDEKHLENLTEVELRHLCKNPKAIGWFENNPERITMEMIPSLFENKAAHSLLVSQGFDCKYSLTYGTKSSILYPSFDKEECRKILRGEQDKPTIVRGLTKNTAAKQLIAEHLADIKTNYVIEFYRIASRGHLFDVVLNNLNMFDNEALFRKYLNRNPKAISYLKENPRLIIYTYLAKNPKGMPLVEEYLLVKKINAEGDYIFVDEDFLSEDMDDHPDWYGDCLLDNVNQHPEAISFLLTHPKLITEKIVKNPNIFEEVVPEQV